MSKLTVWFYIISTVLIALAANAVGAIWASKDNKFSLWLLLLIVISPLVFISFGLVTAKIGVAVSSATIDTILAISTILVGLFFFHEASNISIYQYMGIASAIFGMVLMQIHK